MDWFKKLLQSLPLDAISDLLGSIIVWWSRLVDGVPPGELPMIAYVCGSIIVLLLWWFVARLLPRPLGGISWVMLFAILFAPGSALGDPSSIAPASISVVYAIMMQDFALAITNMLPVLVVMMAGLFLGFIWQLLRGAIESNSAKYRQRESLEAKESVQLAGVQNVETTEAPIQQSRSVTLNNLVKRKKSKEH